VLQVLIMIFCRTVLEDFEFIVKSGDSECFVFVMLVWESISIIRQALAKCQKEMNTMLTFQIIIFHKEMFTIIWVTNLSFQDCDG
jgi:hypothetical protein